MSFRLLKECAGTTKGSFLSKFILSSYNIPLHRFSRYVTQFICAGMRFQYLVLPFGMSVSAYICQMFLNAMARVCRNYVMWAHVDYMILADPDPAKLRLAIAILRAKVSAIKWRFSAKSVFYPRDSIEFLGAKWSSLGIQRMPQATRMIKLIINITKDMTIQESKLLQQLRDYLNYYYCYAPGMHVVINKWLTWPSERKKAFLPFIMAVTEADFLQVKRAVIQRVVVFTDATTKQIGVLMKIGLYIKSRRASYQRKSSFRSCWQFSRRCLTFSQVIS